MRKFKTTLVALLSIALFLCSTALFVFSEDEGVGEYVSEAAPHGHGAAIPAGHYGLIAKYADRFLSNPPGPHRTIFADILMDGTDLDDVADELDDFFVLDIRSKPTNNRLDYDYCIKGHIPGAVWIPFEDVAKPENLAMLPVDRPILIVCYTGHTASQINAILNLLGYNAWTLRFGMTSWYAENKTKFWSDTNLLALQVIYGARKYYVDKYPLEFCN